MINILFKKLINKVKYNNYLSKKNNIVDVTENYKKIIDLGFFSQEGQDKFLNKIFNKNKGYYVDIGASDGIKISNSYFFEKLGWDGIAIEANPKQFKNLISNRKCKCLNICIGKKANKKIFLQIDGPAKNYSGLLDNYNYQHLRKAHLGVYNRGGKINYLEISVLNLNDVVENNIIDILFIDTEGSEFDILKSIDFNKLKIKSICVENFYKDFRIFELLKKNDYHLIAKTTHDEIYKKNPSI
tara:strand:+ start:105 stop:830 length:726 start_codon:yes stop_codon:yes gene_type:complete